MTNESIPDKLKNIEEKLDKLADEKKSKPFRMPLSMFLSRGKFTKDRYVVVQLIRANGSVKMQKVKIEDNAIKLDNDLYYDASASYILRYKRYPMLILTEWSTQPFSIKEEVQKAENSGTLTPGQRYIWAKMKADVIKPGFTFDIKWILIILAVAGGALWLLNKYKII